MHGNGACGYGEYKEGTGGKVVRQKVKAGVEKAGVRAGKRGSGQEGGGVGNGYSARHGGEPCWG